MMGNCYKRQFIPVPEEDLEYLRENTTYTHGEIRHLFNRYVMLTKGRRYIIKRDLFLMRELQSNPITVMIVNALFGNKNRIRFKEFAMFFHIFKAQDSTKSDEMEKRVQAKLHLLFNMYDANKDGRITKEELFDIVHRMYSEDEMDYFDCMRVVEIITAEADSTETGQILFNDFVESMGSNDIDDKLMIRIPES